MIHEYALEPELVATWTDRQVGRYFIEKFGLGQPRVVSRYPKRWRKLVWEAFRSENEIERKRMEELIARLSKPTVKRPEACWALGRAWLENAEDEHDRVPFHAILARGNPRDHGHVLVADDLDDTAPRWTPPRGQCVSRSADALADVVAAMLRNASQVIFVDPHFGPENSRHRKTLRAFLRRAVGGRPGPPPELIQVRCSADGGATESFFRKECESRLPRIVPRGLRVNLVRLRQQHGGERLHNRYILTDLGGVSFGVGLDQGDAGDSDDLQLLDRAQYERRWTQYASHRPSFDQSEPPVEIEGAE